MDKRTLTKIVQDSIEQGICDESVLRVVHDSSIIDSGQVLTSSLLHTYTRRLRRAPGGSELHEATMSLVEILKEIPDEHLSMIGVRTTQGDFRLLLANSEESKILFWLKMFDK
jgi:hypothetical protein